MLANADLVFAPWHVVLYVGYTEIWDMTEAQRADFLGRYSEGQISAIELRRALGGITFGDVLSELAKRDLALPRAPEAGRQGRIAAARALLFPKAA